MELENTKNMNECSWKRADVVKCKMKEYNKILGIGSRNRINILKHTKNAFLFDFSKRLRDMREK